MQNIIIFLNAFLGVSGGDQMLRQIFKRIENNFNDIYCFTSNDGKDFLQGEVKRFKYILTPTLQTSLIRSTLFNVFVIYILRTVTAVKVILKKDINIDIVHVGSDFFPDIIPALLYKMTHPKVRWIQCVFHIYPSYKNRPGNVIINFLSQSQQKLLFLLILKRVDLIICINGFVQAELITMGFDPQKIVINSPGIDLEYLKNLSPDSLTPKYTGTFLGRLHPSKGIFDLIKIWQEIVKQFPTAKLAIIGGGDNAIKNKLKQKIHNANLNENIDILGYLPDRETFKIIKNSDVFVFPSHEEGFAIAIAESLACGIPVVAWNLPVYKEIFENKINVVEKGNIFAMTSKIVAVIKSKKEYTVKNTDLANYDWAKTAENYLNIIYGQTR